MCVRVPRSMDGQPGTDQGPAGAGGPGPSRAPRGGRAGLVAAPRAPVRLVGGDRAAARWGGAGRPGAAGCRGGDVLRRARDGRAVPDHSGGVPAGVGRAAGRARLPRGEPGVVTGGPDGTGPGWGSTADGSTADGGTAGPRRRPPDP